MIAYKRAQEWRKHPGDDPVFTMWIDRCPEDIKRLFIKPDLKVVMESETPDGLISDHFDARMLNPGHATEAAWSIMREAGQRKDAQLLEPGCDMLDWMRDRGWDTGHGDWLGYLHRDESPSNTLKENLWKSFFHHPRALWMCHQLAPAGGL